MYSIAYVVPYFGKFPKGFQFWLLSCKCNPSIDFPIFLERPYKLCDFKPAYGEIFAEELKDYDFWGHCDIDLVWGNIRKFYTDEVLSQYEKVGFNGHSNLYKNTPEVCARYRTHIDGKMYYRDVYSVDKGFAFDEPGMDDIYEALQIPVYKKIDFANLLKYDYGFFLDWGKEEDKNNCYGICYSNDNYASSLYQCGIYI